MSKWRYVNPNPKKCNTAIFESINSSLNLPFQLYLPTDTPSNSDKLEQGSTLPKLNLSPLPNNEYVSNVYDVVFFFDRYHFFSDQNIFHKNYGAHHLVKECGLTSKMRMRDGDLSKVCNVALECFNMEAELVSKKHNPGNTLVKLSGSLSPMQLISFMGFYGIQVKNSIIGKDYYFDPSLLLKKEELVFDLRKGIKKRLERRYINSKNPQINKLIRDYLTQFGFKVSTSDNLIYGEEEVYLKNPEVYGKLIEKIVEFEEDGYIL